MSRRRFGVVTVAAVLLGGTGLLAPAAQAAGSVSLAVLGATYTQDFNTLASTGTANTAVPPGWDFAESGTNANSTYRAGTGSDTTGDTYSFGSAGSAERAFGGLRSGNLVPLVGAQLTNNTGRTITSLDISYTGEQWRLGQNASGRPADRLDFQMSTTASGLSSGSWADYDALDFSSPVVAGTVGALDGNAAANRTTIASTISGLTIQPGATFWVRWADSDLIPGSDDGLSVDDFSLTPNGSNDAAPFVTSTTPAAGATKVDEGSDITVTFSEPVDVGAGAFGLSCTSGTRTLSVSGGPDTFTLDPASDFATGDDCTLTVYADQVSDQDLIDPPDHPAANTVVAFQAGDVCTLPYTPAYAIQGSGPAAAITGTVTTQGVVVGDYEYPGSGLTSASLRGFYLQDVTGDGDPATSDAVFVFNGNNNSVQLGDVVRVTGTAGEFQDQTQVSAGSVTGCGTGSVAPTDVTLPFTSAGDAERFEGMLVRLPQELSVTEHFQLGRFGQVLLSSGGRLHQPTNVTTPGTAANTLQAANDLNQILIDDGSQGQNPDPIVFGRGGQPLSASNTLRGGDTATGITGVMTYTWGGNSASPNAFRVRPVNALGAQLPDFQPANPRPESAPARTGGVRVAAMNLLNFFNTFDGLPDKVDNCTNGVNGPATDCRGADTQAEFDRQWPKTVAAIVGTQADVIGVNEVENDGYGPDSALQFLVDKLNEATAPGTYALIDVDARTGQTNAMGTDAIKVGMLYKPAVVTPVGATAALNTEAFVNGGDSAPRSRPSLAQAFERNATGARFVVDVNHLKSKGSACDTPDAGDGQGNCNVERTNAAKELTKWLATDPTGIGDPDTLIMGDLNSYAQEDPVTALKNAGYRNLIEERIGQDAYSYVFDGQWGYLDHALASPSMDRQVSSVAEWHINSDEPSVLDYNTDFKTKNLELSLYAPDQFRISDHDPVLVDLALDEPPVVTTPSVSPEPSVEGHAATASATFSDAGNDSPYTCTVDYGDGTGPVAGSVSGTTCTGPAHTYPTYGTYPVTVAVTDSDGSTGSASTQHAVVFAYSGFFSPVDNFPTVNVVNAGQAVPVKFSLGGDKGLAIFASGPTVTPTTCSPTAVSDLVEETVAASSSGLRYDATTDTYVYVWKTQKSWANTCQLLTFTLVDGTPHKAIFRFTG